MKPLCAILVSGSRWLTLREKLLVQLERMLRAPQILTWSCSIRSLLLWKESHHTGAVWQSAGHVRGRKCKDSNPGNGRIMEEVLTTVPCSSKLFLGSMYYDNHKMKEALFPYLQSKAILSSYRQPPQYVASAKARRASNPWKCSLVGDLGQNTKAVSTYCDCLSNTTCLQPWRRPCQRSLSFTSKTLCNLFQNHLYCRRYCVRPFCSSTHMPRTLKHFHTRPQASSFSPQQTRRLHQAAPCAVAAWRDCLSPENENRCRQSLRPNLKLYELEQERKWTLSQGKNQGRCASVLVSLCSVGEEPAFLFTLRSSTLKGRHKGDVSFAGGKSDPSDRDVVATALREAREELGITVASERIWGVLKPLRDVSGMMIAPVLANIGALEDLTFKPNPGEVEEIFTLSLSHLCNPQNRGYTHFRIGDKYCYTLPVFRNGKHKVWGLTAVALDQTLKLIVPS